MTDADDGSPLGWLDMSRYPDLDPDQAVPDSALRTVQSFLLSHDVAPLPEPAWAGAVGSALLAGGTGHGPAPDADVPGDSAGDNEVHPPGWPPDDLAGGHGDALPSPPPGDEHPHGDSPFEGGHW